MPMTPAATRFHVPRKSEPVSPMPVVSSLIAQKMTKTSGTLGARNVRFRVDTGRTLRRQPDPGLTFLAESLTRVVNPTTPLRSGLSGVVNAALSPPPDSDPRVVERAPFRVSIPRARSGARRLL